MVNFSLGGESVHQMEALHHEGELYIEWGAVHQMGSCTSDGKLHVEWKVTHQVEHCTSEELASIMV